MKNLPFQRIKGVATQPVPATWPNRAVRRAVLYGRSLSQEWTTFFFKNPELKTFLRNAPKAA